MRRLGHSERKGLGRLPLLIWGLAFVLAGIISRSILQNGILDMYTLTGEELLEKMSASTTAMAVATAALVLQAVETCAIPILAFLLTEEFEKGKSRKKLLLCLFAMAVVSEIPYNYAAYGALWHTDTRNPAVALVVGLAVLYFFHRYGENTFANVLVKIFVGFSALLWVAMLRVDHGVPFLLVMMTLWAARKNRSMRILFGGAMAAVCALFDPLYLMSALGIFPVFFYREEEEGKQQEIPVVFYAVYPVLLAVAGIVSLFL